MFEVKIKNGNSGHHDIDNCDLKIADIPSENIPRKGDVIQIFRKGSNNYGDKYLVQEVDRSYLFGDEFHEFIAVYVIRM